MDIETLLSCTDVDTLVEQLRTFDNAYEQDNPIIDDDTYDALKNHTRKLDSDHEYFNDVGAPVPKDKEKEKLPFMMGSLRTKYEDEFPIWIRKHTTCRKVISHKLDGLSLEVEYKNGVVVNAWLRGDGIEGENVTRKAKIFMPLLKCNDNLFIRGEVQLDCDASSIGMKNKRNAVSGIIRRESTDEHADHLFFLAHCLMNPIDGSDAELSEVERFDILSNIIPTVRYKVLESDLTSDQLIQECKDLLDEDTEYDKDGVVIAADGYALEHIKHPDHKIAFKDNQQYGDTDVQYLEYRTSRNGHIVPRAFVDPLDLGGVTIIKGTAFNAKFVKDNKLGPGAKIRMCRAGDVIPHIEEVLEGASVADIPTICPSCKEPIKWEKSGVHIICDNPECDAQLLNKIFYFFERLGLKYYAKKKFTSLLENFTIESVIDVFNLTAAEIQKVDRWGKKSSTDFVDRINALKQSDPVKFMSAFGVHTFGRSVAKWLFKAGWTVETLFQTAQDDPTNMKVKLTSIDGIKDKKAFNIVDGLAEQYDLYNKLITLGFKLDEIVLDKKEENMDNTGKSLGGKSFCVTGKLSQPRTQIEALIVSKGGTIGSAAKCSHLLWDGEQQGSKINKVNSRIEKGGDVVIISEEDLNNMISV